MNDVKDHFISKHRSESYLFGKKHRYDRHSRRRISGRKKVAQVESSQESDKGGGESESSSSFDEDDGDSYASKCSRRIKEESDGESDGTEDYDPGESSSVDRESSDRHTRECGRWEGIAVTQVWASLQTLRIRDR